MTKKERRTRLLIASGIVIAFVLLVLGVFGWIYMAENGYMKPKTVPYEQINFTTTDYKSMEFALNGQVMTFPVTVADVEAAGYKLDEVYRSEILPGISSGFMGTGSVMYTTLSCAATSDSRNRVKFTACNLTKENLSVLDCSIEALYAEDESLILCNGISLLSSYEEVIAVMGEPTEYEEDYNCKELTYEIDDNYFICIIYRYGDYETIDTLKIYEMAH